MNLMSTTRGLRKMKPKRKTSCYFDPWKQTPQVLASLIRKGIIDIRKLGFDWKTRTDPEESFS